MEELESELAQWRDAWAAYSGAYQLHGGSDIRSARAWDILSHLWKRAIMKDLPEQAGEGES